MFDDVRLILERASRESALSGGNARDSLHLAAAHLLKADVFITTEKRGKSLSSQLSAYSIDNVEHRQQ